MKAGWVGLVLALAGAGAFTACSGGADGGADGGLEAASDADQARLDAGAPQCVADGGGVERSGGLACVR